MNYLLDTHTLIWFLNGNKELSLRARKEIEQPNIKKFISIATLWEIAIKISLAKLKLNKPFNEINRQILENGFELLPVSFDHTHEVSKLEFHHRDPFDRILIAQAITEKLIIISKDGNFHKYKVKLLW